MRVDHHEERMLRLGLIRQLFGQAQRFRKQVALTAQGSKPDHRVYAW